MQNTTTLTPSIPSPAQQIKREIQEVRYAIAIAANAPNAEERLPELYKQLTALYERQDTLKETLQGEHRPQRRESSVWN